MSLGGGGGGEDDLRSVIAQHNLSSQELGLGYVFDSSAVVVFGVFTSLMFGRVHEQVSDERLKQITLLMLAFTLAVFKSAELFVNSRAIGALWCYSRDACRLLLQLTHKLLYVVLFLLTHFLSVALIKMWTDAQLRLAESLAVMWSIFIGIYATVLILRKAREASRLKI
jgi:hypothetical protein